ncbi:MAG: sterol desaturase family protein [Mycobacterium sp.]
MMPWAKIESSTYWFFFVASFVAVAAWESWRPKQQLATPVGRRWSRHGLAMMITSFITVAIYRASPVIVAVAALNNRFGVFNKTWLPFPVRFIAALLVLDFVKYAVHRVMHSASWLWRVHHVHHSDPDLDVSTGGRTHPIEIVLTQGLLLATVALLALPPAGVLAAELVSLAQVFISHANVSLPAWLDSRLRWVFVTPDMHRIHHSEEIREQWTNLGDIFSLWDRLFRTYLPEPAVGRDHVVVGLKGFQGQRSLNLGFMLLFPFRGEQYESAAESENNNNREADGVLSAPAAPSGD